MAPSQIFELPRPRKFFQTMSLRTGAEIITFLQVINKVSGLYGLLALVTGAAIDGWQLSMYLYSSIILFTTVYLYKHVRLQSPFETLLLAHLYVVDSIVNALFTVFFGVLWFYMLANHPDAQNSSMGQNAGFTDPKHNVSHVDIVASPKEGLKAGQDAVAVGQGQGTAAPTSLSNAVFQSGSIMSISLISGFWALRVYFLFVMLAFSRQCLRQHIAANAATSGAWYTAGADASSKGALADSSLAENPFAETRPDGSGWRGKVGRAMLKGAPHYWLGADEDETWMRGVGGKFKKSGASGLEPPLGLGERERRRRSGTGPPAPGIELRTQAPIVGPGEGR